MTIKDADFIRGKVPLTKQEVRAVTLSKLAISGNDHFLDIGAGTGGISIEAALLQPQARVSAIDNNEEAVGLIRQNAKKFGVQHIDVRLGTAPEGLTGIEKPTKIFIGGSKGNLPEIFEWIKNNAAEQTTVVANAITLETLESLRKCIKEYGFATPEIIQLAVNRVEIMGRSSLLKAQNPIFIVSTCS